ncbi:MAG: GNAT family N-acetyltransferase [Pseudomonadota bacterium]
MSTHNALMVDRVAPALSAAALGRVGAFDVSVKDDFAEIAPIWRAFQKGAQTTPFQDFDWVQCWLDAFDEDDRPRLVIVLLHLGNDLCGILPLYETRHMTGRVVSWMADASSDYCMPLLSDAGLSAWQDGNAEAILSLASGHLPGVDLVKLTNQPADLAGKPNPFATFGRPVASGEAHYTEVGTPWKPFYEALRSSKTRSRLRQKWRRLAKRGRLVFRSAKGTDEVEAALMQIIDWKIEQLHERGNRNPFMESDGSRAHLTRTLLCYAHSGVVSGKRGLRVFGLYLDGEMIAGYASFVENGRISVFVNSYAPDLHTDCSPGLLLLVRILEFASRTGHTTLDLMRGGEAYKQDWCDKQVLLVDSLHPLTMRGRVMAGLHRLKLDLKHRLSANPAAKRFILSMNKRLKGQGAEAGGR